MVNGKAAGPVGLRPGALDLRIVRGDAFSERFEWYDANEDPLDVTGWVLEGQLRATYQGALLAQFTIDRSGLPDNEMNLQLTDAQTTGLGEGVYPWDLVRISGGPINPRTVLQGVAVVSNRSTEPL